MGDVEECVQSPFGNVSLEPAELKLDLVLVIPIVSTLHKLELFLLLHLRFLTFLLFVKDLLDELRESLLVDDRVDLNEVVRDDVLLQLESLLDVVEVVLVANEDLCHVVTGWHLVLSCCIDLNSSIELL